MATKKTTKKTKRKQVEPKQDLFAILTIDLDANDITETQFRDKLKRLLKDHKTKAQIENYVTGKLKPFGLVAATPSINTNKIYPQ